MGMREWFNENPRATGAIVGVIVLAAVAGVVAQVLANRRTFPTGLPNAYYTVDDGKTFFTANMENVPPFDHHGKPAVRAYVYECKGQRSVGYVERYNAEAHKEMIEKRATVKTQISGRELKKPGSATWVKSDDHRAVAPVVEVRCADGSRGEPVEP
jgi:hypothetical protein